MAHYLDFKTLFKSPVFLLSSIATFLSVVVVFIISIYTGQTTFYNLYLNAFNVKNDILKSISYFLSIDYLALAYCVGMFILWLNSNKNKSLNKAAALLYISSLLKVIGTVIIAGVFFCIGLTKDVYTQSVFIQYAGVLLFYVVVVHLPQFVFFYSVRKSIKQSLECRRGAKIAAITSYIFAVLSLFPIFTQATNIFSVLLILSTAFSYLLKGAAAHSYFNFIKNEGLIETKNKHL